MDPQRLDGLLGRYRQQAIAAAPSPLQQVRDVWPTVVGELLAQKTRPTSVQQQVLRVATASPTWAQNLSFERHRILERLNTATGLDLRDIRFSSGRWRETPLPPPPLDSDLQRQARAQHPSLGNASAGDRHGWQLCPRCRVAAPPGELQRWGCCSLCVRGDWADPVPAEPR